MDLAEQIELACLIEATARKPGNVHPGASFDDLTYDDFVTAARISAPILAQAGELGVGKAVLEAVKATVAETGTNVNLGICLLIAPLAAVPADQPLLAGIRPVLKRLTVDDAKFVYEAIRLSQPGGLGTAEAQDVRDEPTQTLWEVMKLASDRDAIAGEYETAFDRVLRTHPALLKVLWNHLRKGVSGGVFHDGWPAWELATIGVELNMLREFGDTLIRRKCGDGLFQQTMHQAEFAIKLGFVYSFEGLAALTDFDAWLRADGHRRNPGTTADLIAAIWFVAIRENMIVPPTKEEIFSHAARIRNAGRMTK